MATIRKRGRGYEIRAYAGSDVRGKRIEKSKMFYPAKGLTPLQEAKEVERQKCMFEDEVKGGRATDDKIRLKDFVKIWDEYAIEHLSKKTYYRYLEYLTRILEALGHKKLKDIRAIHLNEFYKNLSEDGINKKATRDKNGNIVGKGKLAPKTILEHHHLISRILNLAVKWRYVSENVAQYADPPKVPYVEREFLSEEQARRLIRLLDREHIRYRTMIIVLIYTGLRRGELLGLKWSDIDFDERTLKICRSLQNLGRNECYVKEPKTRAGIRQLTIGSSLCNLLLEYKAWQDGLRADMGDLWIDSGYIFTRDNGEYFLPDTITAWFRKFVSKTNLPKVKLHSLRHTNATLLIAEGTDVKTVSTRLGHASTGITLNIYAHMLKSKDKEAADKLDELLTVNRSNVVNFNDFQQNGGKVAGN
jgi:integrase